VVQRVAVWCSVLKFVVAWCKIRNVNCGAKNGGWKEKGRRGKRDERPTYRHTVTGDVG